MINFVGYGFRYIKDNWNLMDFSIIFCSWAGIIITELSTFQLGPQVTIIKSLRIVRLLFFITGNHALRSTIMTFLATMPALINMGGLLLLLIFIYAILGMYLFADVKLNGGLDVHSNFQTVSSSLFTLFRALSGEEWPKIMEGISI